MTGDYLWDRSGPRDPEFVRLEGLMGSLGQPHPPAPFRFPDTPRRSPSWSFFASFAAVAAAVAALVGFTWTNRLVQTPSFQLTRVSGAPTVGARAIDDQDELKVGRWLETGDEARAAITVANIGQVQIEPNTRVGLVSTKPGDYRLRLMRGTMHALIWSPPGQFFVETPSSTAVDLGCAYTMTVDDGGVGLVEVTNGWVGFEWRGQEAFIPAGAIDITRPGLGPGTPHFKDTSDAYKAALVTIDMHGGSAADRAAAVTRVLAESRPRDTVTLWHLLTRVDLDQRDRVFNRLAEFVPAPPEVTREGIRAGRREMLDRWWDKLGLGTTNWWRVWKQPWREQ